MKRFFVTVALLGATGCLAPAMYRTARVLPDGEWDLGLGFSAAQVRTGAYSVDRDTVRFPKSKNTYVNFVPEVSFHRGFGNNLELGGRVIPTAAGLELDLKYGLVGSEESTLHVAVQPALGGRLPSDGGYGASADMGGYHAALPILVTYDIVPRIAVTGSVFGLFTAYRYWTDNEPDLVGNVAYGGGSLSCRFHVGDTFYLVPSVEAQRSLWRGRKIGNTPTVTVFVAGLGLGWGAPLPKAGEQAPAEPPAAAAE